jgi:hypothetical protein
MSRHEKFQHFLPEAVRPIWPLCQVMKVVFKMTNIINILWWIVCKNVHETFPVAAAHLKDLIKRFQAQKSQAISNLFT